MLNIFLTFSVLIIVSKAQLICPPNETLYNGRCTIILAVTSCDASRCGENMECDQFNRCVCKQGYLQYLDEDDNEKVKCSRFDEFDETLMESIKNLLHIEAVRQVMESSDSTSVGDELPGNKNTSVPVQPELSSGTLGTSSISDEFTTKSSTEPENNYTFTVPTLLNKENSESSRRDYEVNSRDKPVSRVPGEKSKLLKPTTTTDTTKLASTEIGEYHFDEIVSGSPGQSQMILKGSPTKMVDSEAAVDLGADNENFEKPIILEVVKETRDHSTTSSILPDTKADHELKTTSINMGNKLLDSEYNIQNGKNQSRSLHDQNEREEKQSSKIAIMTEVTNEPKGHITTIEDKATTKITANIQVSSGGTSLRNNDFSLQDTDTSEFWSNQPSATADQFKENVNSAEVLESSETKSENRSFLSHINTPKPLTSNFGFLENFHVESPVKSNEALTKVNEDAESEFFGILTPGDEKGKVAPTTLKSNMSSLKNVYPENTEQDITFKRDWSENFASPSQKSESYVSSAEYSENKYSQDKSQGLQTTMATVETIVNENSNSIPESSTDSYITIISNQNSDNEFEKPQPGFSTSSNTNIGSMELSRGESPDKSDQLSTKDNGGPLLSSIQPESSKHSLQLSENERAGNEGAVSNGEFTPTTLKLNTSSLESLKNLYPENTDQDITFKKDWSENFALPSQKSESYVSSAEYSENKYSQDKSQGLQTTMARVETIVNENSNSIPESSTDSYITIISNQNSDNEFEKPQPGFSTSSNTNIGSMELSRGESPDKSDQLSTKDNGGPLLSSIQPESSNHSLKVSENERAGNEGAVSNGEFTPTTLKLNTSSLESLKNLYPENTDQDITFKKDWSENFALPSQKSESYVSSAEYSENKYSQDKSQGLQTTMARVETIVNENSNSIPESSTDSYITIISNQNSDNEFEKPQPGFSTSSNTNIGSMEFSRGESPDKSDQLSTKDNGGPLLSSIQPESSNHSLQLSENERAGNEGAVSNGEFTPTTLKLNTSSLETLKNLYPESSEQDIKSKTDWSENLDSENKSQTATARVETIVKGSIISIRESSTDSYFTIISNQNSYDELNPAEKEESKTENKSRPFIHNRKTFDINNSMLQTNQPTTPAYHVDSANLITTLRSTAKSRGTDATPRPSNKSDIKVLPNTSFEEDYKSTAPLPTTTTSTRFNYMYNLTDHCLNEHQRCTAVCCGQNARCLDNVGCQCLAGYREVQLKFTKGIYCEPYDQPVVILLGSPLYYLIIGAVCLGLAVGYLTFRCFERNDHYFVRI